MAKVNLPSVVSGYNLQKINDNDQALATELNENVLYRRNPTREPNEMHNDLDMNSNRVYNLPEPNVDHEAARYKDVRDVKDWAEKSKDAYEKILEALAAGSVYIGNYAPGLVIDEYTNFFGRDGLWWRPLPDLELPYTITGDWATEEDLFIPIGGYRQTGPGAVSRTLVDKARESVSIKDYGAIGDGELNLLAEKFNTLADAQAAYPHVTSLNQSIDWAAAQAAATSGAVNVIVPPGRYMMTDTLVIPDGVQFEGKGLGYEHWHPTTFLFVGPGQKDFSIPGAVGATVANPDSGAPYLGDSGTRGNNYKMIDLSQPFSAGIVLGRASGLRNLGVVPNFDGIDGYSGTDGRLSDDWDMGVWCRNSSGWSITECTIFGHWRKAAQLVTSSDIGDGRVPENELGHAGHTHLCGFRALVVRAPDVVVGDNYGFAGTDWVNCYFRSLRHQSGHLATSSRLDTPFLSPSGCIEMHGYDNRVRGLQFLNCTAISSDDFILFTDKAWEIQFDGCYFEAKTTRVNGALLPNSTGARMVATGNSILAFNGQTKYGVDFSPYYVRESSAERYSSTGVFAPNRARDSEFEYPMLGTSKGNRIQPGGIYRVWDSDFNAAFTVRDDGTARIEGGFDTLKSNNGFVTSGENTLSLYRDVSGTQVPVMRAFVTGNIQFGSGSVTVDGLLRPLNDNATNLGSSLSRFQTVFAVTPTINTSDAREKTDPLPIDDAMLDAWGEVSIIVHQWLDAVALKGEDGARWHFGVIAQQVRDAFLDRGIDATRYGFLCYDEWDDVYEPITEVREVVFTDVDGSERTISKEVETGEMRLVHPAGNRWGIRPIECLFLEAAYQRRRMDRLEERLGNLE